jgi:hypothetical protein
MMQQATLVGTIVDGLQDANPRLVQFQIADCRLQIEFCAF